MTPTSGPVRTSAILDYLGKRVVRQRTNEGLVVTGAAALTPGRQGSLSFSSGQSPQHVRAIAASQSSLLLVSPQAFDVVINETDRDTVAVDNPRREFARVVREFFTEKQNGVISPAAVVDPSAAIGANTTIEPGAYIAPGVVVGAECRIGANAVLLEGTLVGDHTSIGPNTTIGHVGFGYARENDGSPVLIPHSGGVSIGSHVDIGSNTCVDRGTLDDTVIEDHAKVDNLVHIAHNCCVEEGAFVIATAILCGGVQIGPRAWIAPNASIREQLRVGAGAIVGLASTVIRDVPDGVTVVGSPAKQVLR